MGRATTGETWSGRSVGVTFLGGSNLLCIGGCQWSVSRCNHWLPGREAHPDVVQGTADLHPLIADALLPQPEPVFDKATTLHTAVHMLDPQPPLLQRLVGSRSEERRVG